MRGVTQFHAITIINKIFLLTRLMRGVTTFSLSNLGTSLISTHTPHARRDDYYRNKFAEDRKFLLTRLMRGVTELRDVGLPIHYISTHTPHARRDPTAKRLNTSTWISTHTPHARRDKF